MNNNSHDLFNLVEFKDAILNITNELLYFNNKYNNLLENIDINSLMELLINFNILFTYMKNDLICTNNNSVRFTELNYNRLHISILDELNYNLQTALIESEEIPNYLINISDVNIEDLDDLTQYIADLLTEHILRKFYNEIILNNVLICEEHDFIYGEVFSIDVKACSKINNYNFYTLDYNKKIYEYLLKFKVKKMENIYD